MAWNWAASVAGEPALNASFISLGISAVLIAGIAIRSTCVPPREVEAQARITPLLESAPPVRATIGSSSTIEETFVPANVSEGVSPAGRSPLAGTNGPLTKFTKPTKSMKNGSSRCPAKARMPPASAMIGAFAVALPEGCVTLPVIGSPRPLTVNVLPENVNVAVASATRSPLLSTSML